MALVPGVRPILEVGGKVFTNVGSLIVLWNYSSASATPRSTARKTFTGSGYTPSGTKTFEIGAIRVTSDTSSAVQLRFAYVDADIGFDTTTSFTNPVYGAGNSNVRTHHAYPTAGIYQQLGMYAIVPNAKYIGVELGTNSVYIGNFFGYEV